MVQLPTRDDLGGLPSARSGRVIASYDTSAAGRGAAQLGEAIGGAANDIGRLAGSSTSGGIGGVNQAQKFETNRKFLEFVSGQQQAYEDSKSSVDPGAFGFREQAQKQYMDAAKQFFTSIPKALQPEYDAKLFNIEDDFLNKSRAFETTERTRYYGEEVNKGLTTIESDLFSNPGNFDRNFAAGVEHINAIPDESLSRIQKADLVKQWRSKAQLASLNGVTPQERIRLLGGTPNRPEAQPSSARGQEVTRGISGDIRKIVSDAAATYGVDPNALLTITWIESKGNPNAKNPKSSAGGLLQFIDSTARAYGLQNKFDPAQSADAGARLMRDNSQALEKVLGRRPTTGELYLAHQQGISGATKLLSNPNAKAVDVVGSDAVRLNGGNSGMTAGDFAMLWMKKAGDTHVPDGGVFNAQYDASRADPRFADIGYDAANKIIRSAQAEVEASINEAESFRSQQVATAKAQYDQHKGSLELALETGELNSELSILNDEFLTDAHKADMIKAFRAKREEGLLTGEAVRLFNDGALNVDPYDSKGRKTVDNVWGALTKSAEDGADLGSSAEDLVRQTGTVPQQVVNSIRKGATSTDVEEVVSAAQTAQRLSAVDPAALARRDGGKEAQTLADDFSHYVNNLNLSPEEAAEKIAASNDPEKKRDRKALEPAAKEFAKQIEGEDLGAVFDESWAPFSDPDIGFTEGQALGIQAEYQAIAQEQFYKANGDVDVAKNRAKEEMKRLYGVTNLTGRSVVMKHPPERYWPKDTSSEGAMFGIGADPLGYAKNQLYIELAERDADFDTNSVQFVTTPATEQMIKRGEMPGYSVFYTDKDGVVQTFPGQLWRPDFKPAERAIQNRQAKRVDDAVAADEFQRERVIPGQNREQSLDNFLDGPGPNLSGGN